MSNSILNKECLVCCEIKNGTDIYICGLCENKMCFTCIDKLKDKNCPYCKNDFSYIKKNIKNDFSYIKKNIKNINNVSIGGGKG